jgi:hypothetical protein
LVAASNYWWKTLPCGRGQTWGEIGGGYDREAAALLTDRVLAFLEAVQNDNTRRGA